MFGKKSPPQERRTAPRGSGAAASLDGALDTLAGVMRALGTKSFDIDGLAAERPAAGI